MRTNYGLRDFCRNLVRFVDICQPQIQKALLQLRCGYAPNSYTVKHGMKWVNQLAEMLVHCAVMEVMDLNETQPADRRIQPYRKPRWSAKKAPPKPALLSDADQETYLEGLVRWVDAMKQSTEGPPGECHPYLPKGLQAVLARNGYDPKNWRSPARMLKECLAR